MKMKEKKSKVPIEFEVWKQDFSGYISTIVTIDLNDLVDYHEYHDAPISVTWHPTKEELVKLQNLVNDALQKYEELEG